MLLLWLLLVLLLWLLLRLLLWLLLHLMAGNGCACCCASWSSLLQQL